MSNYLDEEGYPTELLLGIISNYQAADMPILDFLETYIFPHWWGGERQYKLHQKYKGVRKLQLHTGGWSGNEDMINAIMHSFWLTEFPMQYLRWERGGHYYFEIQIDKNE